MKRIEDILAVCIEDIKEGKATLESCLRQYPDVRDKIEPLLITAFSIQEPPETKPSPAFKTRARVELIESIHAEKAARVSHPSGFHVFGGTFLQSRLTRGIAISLVIVIVVLASGTATAYAAQGSLPGETLYSVKLGTEELRSAMAGDDINAVEMELSFAEARLREMGELAARGLPIPPASIYRYEDNISTALRKAGENSKNKSSIKLETISLALIEQFTLLDTLEDTYASSAGEICLQCQESVVTGQTESLAALAQCNPVKAAEMNILAQQNRLQRAVALADAGQETKSENALRQFTLLCDSNQQILQIAQASGHGIANIEELNTQAVHYQTEALDHINGKVSGEIIKAARKGIGQQTNNIIEENPKDGNNPGTSSGSGRNGNNPNQTGNGQGGLSSANPEEQDIEDLGQVFNADNSNSSPAEPGNQDGTSDGSENPGYSPDVAGNSQTEPASNSDTPGKNPR